MLLLTFKAQQLWTFLKWKILIVRALIWYFLPHFWELTHSSLNFRHLWWSAKFGKRGNLASKNTNTCMFQCKFKFILKHAFWILIVASASCVHSPQDVSSNRPKNILQQMHRSTEWKIAWLGFIYTKNSCCSCSLFTHCAKTCSAHYFFHARKISKQQGLS